MIEPPVPVVAAVPPVPVPPWARFPEHAAITNEVEIPSAPNVPR
jgi:hypothetical protein